MADREPLSNLQSVFSCGLVMVLRVMHYVLTSRIYKNGAQQSASGAVFQMANGGAAQHSRRFPMFHLKNRRTFTLFTRWLMVVDDLDSLQDIRLVLPSGSTGNFLFTSQSQVIRDWGIQHQIKLEEFGLDEGTYFLLRRAGLLTNEAKLDDVPNDIRAEALWIVILLGGHALALDQAGAYIDDSGISLIDYIRLLHEQYHALLNTYSLLTGTPRSHPETVTSTILLSFKKASTLSDRAADILYFCSCLSPDEVPEEILAKDVALWPDANAFNAAISALRRYSLIERNSQSRTYSMHRLVHAVVTNSMSPDAIKQWRRRVVHALRLACEDIPASADSDTKYRLAVYIWSMQTWMDSESLPDFLEDVHALNVWNAQSS